MFQTDFVQGDFVQGVVRKVTLGETIYDRPKVTAGRRVQRVSGKLHHYVVGDAVEELFSGVITLRNLAQQEVRIIHDACAGGTLTVTGGSVVGTPTYNTYSTVFTVVPTTTTLTVRLMARKVTIGESTFGKSYLTAGEVLELACPIASDPRLTEEMYDHYQQVAAQTQFEFTMRDDPALEVGDRVLLRTMSEREFGVWNYVLGEAECVVSDTVPIWSTRWSTLVPVVLQRIARTFTGASDATCVAVVDINP